MSYICNKDFFTGQERTIIKLRNKIQILKNQIEKFKKYDEERKQYYKNALIRLGELESTDEQAIISKLRKTIESQKCELNRLNILLRHPNLPEDFDKKLIYDENLKLKEQNSKLTTKNKELLKSNRDLRDKLAITILKNNG